MRGRRLAQVLLALSAVTWFCHLAFAQSQSRTSIGSSSDTGVLLMAHGGSKDWNDQVRSVAAEIDKEMPTEIALGMADRSALQDAIDKLTARGVRQIVAVPLFVSSHSSVIEVTKYLLNLRSDPPKEIADFTMDHAAHDMNGHGAADASPKNPLPRPVKCAVPLRMAPALDRHPILAEILSDRAAAIAKNPAQDVLILVAHGPNDDQENVQWLEDMAALAKLIAAHTSYVRIEYLTLRDDADASVRDQSTAQLRKAAQAANQAGYHVLIVPLLLSYGGIENGLRQRLDGIEHTLSPRALLPDARIAHWVLESANESRARQ